MSSSSPRIKAILYEITRRLALLAQEQPDWAGQGLSLDFLGRMPLAQARASFLATTTQPSEACPSPLFFGPLPSDSIFQRASKGEFDLVVALYHDQGLIPVKLLEPTRAVNLTLGLPFIRTSPDHGTAFDKAGGWIADSRNFLEAAALAARLARRSGLDLPPSHGA